MAETLPALSTTGLKMRSGPAGTSATTSSASSAKGRETHPLHRENVKHGFPRGKTLSCWHQYLDECPPGRGRNPRCFNGLPYRCGFPQITIVCQQIRGHTVRVLLELAARREPGARWVNS